MGWPSRTGVRVSQPPGTAEEASREAESQNSQTFLQTHSAARVQGEDTSVLGVALT